MSPESGLQKVVRTGSGVVVVVRMPPLGGESGNFPPSFSHLTYEGELYGICNYR